jgi:hypothetical protein
MSSRIGKVLKRTAKAVLTIGAIIVAALGLGLLFGSLGFESLPLRLAREQRIREQTARIYQEAHGRGLQQARKVWNERWKKEQAERETKNNERRMETKRVLDELIKGRRRTAWEEHAQVLQHGKVEARVRAAEALGEMGEKLPAVAAREIHDPLSRLPQDAVLDGKVFGAVIRNVRFRTRAVEIADGIEVALTAALKDPEVSVRQAAVQALAQAKVGRLLLEQMDRLSPEKLSAVK